MEFKKRVRVNKSIILLSFMEKLGTKELCGAHHLHAPNIFDSGFGMLVLDVEINICKV